MSAVVAPGWARVDHPGGIGVAERRAIGTDVRVVVAEASALAAAQGAVDTVLDRLDQVASRFRPDSELVRLNELAVGGGTFLLSPELREQVAAALAGARWSGGLLDPTVGAALCASGYDRDLAAIPPDDPRPTAPARPAPGWRAVRLSGALLEVEPGILLDLGSTAKALGADRAAELAATRCGGPVLVSFGGDLAVAPSGAAAWPVLVEEAAGTVPPAGTQAVTVVEGGLATSSTTRRRWQRGGTLQHHLIDPATGAPARGPYRTVSVAAPSCLEANIAATAALVAGDRAVDLLVRSGLPARLVDDTGGTRLLGGGPAGGGGRPPRSTEPPFGRAGGGGGGWA